MGARAIALGSGLRLCRAIMHGLGLGQMVDPGIVHGTTGFSLNYMVNPGIVHRITGLNLGYIDDPGIAYGITGLYG